MSQLVTSKQQETEKSRVNWALLGSLMKGRWWGLVLAFVAMLIAALASYVSPLVIRITLDSMIGQEPLNAPDFVVRTVEALGGVTYISRNLWICSAAIVIFAIINAASSYVRGRSTAAVSEGIAEDLRNRMYDHIQHLPYDYHVMAETGDLLQRSSSDVELVRRFLGMQLIEITRIIISTIIGAVIMISLSPKMTLFSIVILPVLFFSSYIFFRRIQKVFTETDKAEAKLSTTIQESISGVRVVRAFGQQQQEMEKFDVDNNQYRDSSMKVSRLMAAYWGGTDIMAFIQMGLVITAGSYYALQGDITVGTLVAFTSYAGMLLWPLRRLGRILADLGKAEVALGRISAILDEPEEPMNGLQLDRPLKGHVAFENVSFGYENGKKILEDISFEAKPGETVAILGATGSGKSTMMYLLQRLYDVDTGRITIDGIDIQEFHRKWLRKNVGLVLQEPFLYSRSLRDNIGITDPSVSHSEIEIASRMAAMSGMIDEFERGYDTEVGERGVTLSGGQKQRVAIARTLLQNTPVLIFDDSLSAVDTETDHEIRTQLASRRQQATTFIISHRVTTVAQADQILVLENGRITQSGTHEELIGKSGLYQRVWEIQSAEEDLAFAYSDKPADLPSSDQQNRRE